MSGFVRHVVHATDFSPASERAFAHALAAALVREAELTLVHVGAAAEPDWSRFPGVRAMLERWGLLAPGSPRRAVEEELALRIRKVELPAGSPTLRLRQFLRQSAPDLLVLASEGRGALTRWWRPSVADRLAFHGDTPTLRVPASGPGFVDPETGHLSLRRILLPVDHEPSAAPALAFAARAAEALGDPPVRLALLHVGERFPPLLDPPGPALTVERLPGRGAPARVIREVVHDLGPDLLVLPTRARSGRPWHRLRRSVAERAAREAPCPVLAVPVE